MIQLTSGLQQSLLVLQHLQNRDDFTNIDVTVGTFHNGREMGLTFTLSTIAGEYQSFTWCVYEHRNSDEIIINGKDNWSGFNGDLPYGADDKYYSLAKYPYHQSYQCADYLTEMIENKHAEFEMLKESVYA